MGTYQIIGANASNQNCITGETDHLYPHLKEAIARAEKIDINVSFLMVSGIKLILDDLKIAAAKGVAIRILCANYLNITQPEALYLLKDALGDRCDLRFYNVPNPSFHAKAYFFSYPEGEEVFVGSSNLSKSALTCGIEWNYRIDSRTHPGDCAFFRQTFETLLNDHSIVIDDRELKRYAKQWVRPKIYQQLDQLEADQPPESIDAPRPDNRVAQPQAGYVVDVADSVPAPLIAFPQPTATPERLDNQDVFALCDYNVVYEVRLKEAINRGWLTPFRYYGIYDDLDDDQIDFRNGRCGWISTPIWMKPSIRASAAKKDLNPFRDYLTFLDAIGQTTAAEKELLGSPGHAFLRNIENTAMSKTYKMPVLLAFCNNGAMKLAIDDDDLYRSFKAFYEKGSNRVDLLRDKTTANAMGWGKKEYVNLARHNPVLFLAQSAGEFFYRSGEAFCLAPELDAFVTNPVFVGHFKDIIDYRTKRFYKERLEKMESQA